MSGKRSKKIVKGLDFFDFLEKVSHSSFAYGMGIAFCRSKCCFKLYVECLLLFNLACKSLNGTFAATKYQFSMTFERYFVVRFTISISTAQLRFLHRFRF